MSTEQNLAHTLAQARFYGAKSEPIDEVQIHQEEVATAQGDRLCILAVRHGQQVDTYQVLLDADDQDVLGDRATELGEALSLGRPAGSGTWHELRPFPTGLTGRQLSGEQSNTTLIFSDGAHDTAVVKYFRKLQPGINPEVELLSGIADTPHVARLYGWVSNTIDEQDYITAVAQEFIADSQDGWKRALDFGSRGQSFAEDAHLLGQATASVHQALASGFGSSTIDAAEVAQRLTARFEDLRRRVPALEQYRLGVLQHYEDLTGNTPCHRVHGDLHLGQVLRTPDRYVLIDFEGEPARPIAERRRPDAALRDVAGLVRSIDYATHSISAPEGWAEEATTALLAGYGVSADDPFLAAYVLDKALYEVAYEVDNRPDWVSIPQAAVLRLLHQQP
ncbi:hypothetical protein GP475_08390 [Corynebacterium poyangense]|uniref:Maltokinase n=1 Tax=Corynebacterium poyangense TaxID=2684405 RepID=A0A7H0SQ27_9CORY|nr:hypothetical protein [Corynebacterium poyangense]QNQ90652.1 hypothetical protein GP475_08390 [Corynebacterium poyangense]